MEHPTPLPEIRSLVQRANSNRMVLYQLLEQFPADAWDRPDENGAWTARRHLQHLASIDTVTQALVESPDRDEVQLGNETYVQREAAIEALASASIEELTRQLDATRDEFLACLASLDEERLNRRVVIARPGVWPPEQQVSMRAYLSAWAEHDVQHVAAIRQAATAQITPGDMAAAARINRRR